MDHAGAVVGPLVAFIIMIVVVSGTVDKNLFGDFLTHPREASEIMKNGNVDEQTYRFIFWCASIPAILSVLVLAFFVKDIKKTGEQSAKLPILTLKPFDRYFKIFLPIVILFTLGNSSDAFLILRAKNLGVSAVFIPILWVVLHIVKMVSSMPGMHGLIKSGAGRLLLLVG